MAPRIEVSCGLWFFGFVDSGLWVEADEAMSPLRYRNRGITRANGGGRVGGGALGSRGGGGGGGGEGEEKVVEEEKKEGEEEERRNEKRIVEYLWKVQLKAGGRRRLHPRGQRRRRQ